MSACRFTHDLSCMLGPRVEIMCSWPSAGHQWQCQVRRDRPAGDGTSCLFHSCSVPEHRQTFVSFCEPHDTLRALEERALEGLFLAFQSPPAVGGERSSDLLRVLSLRRPRPPPRALDAWRLFDAIVFFL